MVLDKSQHYVYRLGSDNQYRIHWDGSQWQYELLAGEVVFDKQSAFSEEGISEILAAHGLSMNQFEVDRENSGQSYADRIMVKENEFKKAGVSPCPKHGYTAVRPDGSCEKCANPDLFDDFKGTEG
jgi:hypothetical protein